MSMQGLEQSAQAPIQKSSDQRAGQARLMRRLHSTNRIAQGVLWAITGIVVLIFISIIVYLLLAGFTYLFNPEFYTTADPIYIQSRLRQSCSTPFISLF